MPADLESRVLLLEQQMADMRGAMHVQMHINMTGSVSGAACDYCGRLLRDQPGKLRETK